jgi:hypothetical protein
LYLYGNQLSTLPNEICDLVNLQVLFLQNNKITELPNNFNKLKNLRYYDGPNYVSIIKDEKNEPLNNEESGQVILKTENTLYANMYGGYSTSFNTSYPSGFRPYSKLRMFLGFSSIRAFRFLMSKSFRNQLRYTKVFRLENKITDLERSFNPKVNKIERKKNRRLNILAKIEF